MSAHPLDARIAHLEGAFGQVNERLSNLERGQEALRLTMEQRFSVIEHRFDQRFSSMDQRFNWVIGTIVGTWITTILAILVHR